MSSLGASSASGVSSPVTGGASTYVSSTGPDASQAETMSATNTKAIAPPVLTEALRIELNLLIIAKFSLQMGLIEAGDHEGSRYF